MRISLTCWCMVNGRPQSIPSDWNIRARQLEVENDCPVEFSDGFISLCAAVNHGGYELRIARGTHAEKPLLIVHSSPDGRQWTPTVNQIRVGAKARLQLAELFVGAGGEYWRTDISEVQLENGAELSWVRVQEEGPAAVFFGEVQVHLAADARLDVTQLNCGAAWMRNSLKVKIAGERAEAQINGLSFGRTQQHIDQRVRVEHLAPNTNSSQLFKGILRDQARGVLNGKIYIAKNAQKVNSSQLNHNILLGAGAEADTKPELEIYADDVKANHGASVGRLDEEKLFYFLSRGIPRSQARQMLARAFVGDVLMKVADPSLRELLSGRVDGWLPDFIAQMGASL